MVKKAPFSVSNSENCSVVVVILLTKRPIFFAWLTVIVMLALVARKRPEKLVIAASTPRLLAYGNEPSRSGLLLRMPTSEATPLKRWRAEQYRELFSLWHATEDRMLAVPGVVSAAGFYVDRRDGANLAACYEILDVIAQENQNEETRAASRGVLAETAWYHGDLTSAVALMREAVEGYDRVGTALEMTFLRCLWDY
jgi:hypothetical protein